MKTRIQLVGGDVEAVHCEPTPIPGLLAIFRDSEEGAPDLRWSLTHQRSGICVAPLRFRTYEEALEAAGVFELIDMTRPVADIAADPCALECVRFLWAYFPQLRRHRAVAATASDYVDLPEVRRG